MRDERGVQPESRGYAKSRFVADAAKGRASPKWCKSELGEPLMREVFVPR